MEVRRVEMRVKAYFVDDSSDPSISRRLKIKIAVFIIAWKLAKQLNRLRVQLDVEKIIFHDTE
jgi:hypothetical protein